jgi:hypothetical protein
MQHLLDPLVARQPPWRSRSRGPANANSTAMRGASESLFTHTSLPAAAEGIIELHHADDFGIADLLQRQLCGE